MYKETKKVKLIRFVSLVILLIVCFMLNANALMNGNISEGQYQIMSVLFIIIWSVGMHWIVTGNYLFD